MATRTQTLTLQKQNQKPNRHNRTWNINETLRLQREYELLEMNVRDIALVHERTETSIINKLFLEGLIQDISAARK